MTVPGGSGTVKVIKNDELAPVVDVALITRLWSPALNLVKSTEKSREPETHA